MIDHLGEADAKIALEMNLDKKWKKLIITPNISERELAEAAGIKFIEFLEKKMKSPEYVRVFPSTFEDWK